LAANAICPLAANTNCPLAVTVIEKQSPVTIVGAGGRVLDRHLGDAGTALRHEIMGGLPLGEIAGSGAPAVDGLSHPVAACA
jgi:hypothetical protein